jgi:hypothetical protein
MPEKPRVILLLTILYLISPFVITLQAGITANLPVFGPLNIWSKLNLFDMFILAAYVIAGVAIWSIKKPAWYLFMAISAFLILANVLVAIKRPTYQPLLILAYDAVLTLVASIFFRKSIIAPYFHPRLRWWENLPRFYTQIHLHIGSDNSADEPVLRDISKSGCFITTTQTLELHREYDAQLIWFGHNVGLKARIVRIGRLGENEGYGICFVHVSSATTRKLEKMINYLDRLINKGCQTGQCADHIERPTRLRLSDRAWMCHSQGKTVISIMDLSAKGCSFQSATAIPKDGTLVFCWELGSLHLETPCDLAWSKGIEGRHLYGLIFKPDNSKTARDLQNLVTQLKNQGARKRQLGAANPELIDAAADQTPYRYIKRISKIVASGSKN